MVIAIYGLCALLMIGIGITQWKSKKPTGFYSGVEPPKPDELTDVPAWNRKHGLMWILYGVILFFCGLCGMWKEDTTLGLILLLAGPLLPLGLMVWYHERLTRIYRKKE